MCFVLILTRVHSVYPLIVAANRDEARARPALPPARWGGTPTVWAGRDKVAGGTWLGVNDAGLLAAITNRREGENDPARPSRGGLCLGLLRTRSAEAGAAFVDGELARSPFNPFNLLCATPTDGWVRTSRGDRWPLEAGVHVVTNEGDLDDTGQPMVKRGLELAAEIDLRQPDLPALMHQLGRICQDGEGSHPICRPDGERGTVSSSLIAIGADGKIADYWHAPGPPCRVPYAPIDLSRPMP
jgi:uncharacterized protein with NRDE domain